jgi:hypothetical protein
MRNSPNIIRMSKLESIRWEGYGKIRNAYTISVEKPEF